MADILVPGDPPSNNGDDVEGTGHEYVVLAGTMVSIPTVCGVTVNASPLQTVMVRFGMIGVCRTVIVKLLFGPGHETLLLVYVGVTAIVAILSEVVRLVAVNEGILLTPDPASPMVVFPFVQM
jgi:hypothetical protein